MVPDGWKRTTIGNVSKVTSGGTPSRSVPEYWNGEIPWVTTGLINFNVITKAVEYITKEGLANSSAKMFPPKTLLVALYGDGVTRGKVAMLGIDAATNQACAAILPSNNVLPEYAFYYIACTDCPQVAEDAAVTHASAESPAPPHASAAAQSRGTAS